MWQQAVGLSCRSWMLAVKRYRCFSMALEGASDARPVGIIKALICSMPVAAGIRRLRALEANQFLSSLKLSTAVKNYVSGFLPPRPHPPKTRARAQSLTNCTSCDTSLYCISYHARGEGGQLRVQCEAWELHLQLSGRSQRPELVHSLLDCWTCPR